MVILINSSYHNTGSSVLTYMFAKVYGNSMNQPVLFMSLATSEVYKSCLQIDNSWEAQPLSMVINKTHGRSSFKPFCYKLEETLYYYHAVTSTLKNGMGIKDLELLLTKAQLDFGLVIVDIDSEINGFIKLIHIADKVIISLPCDIHAIRKTASTLRDIHSKYEESHGMSIKAEILYALNKYDASVTISEVAKELKTRSTDIYLIQRITSLAREKNNAKLDYFVADLLQKSLKNAEMRKLQIQLNRLMERMRKRGVK